MKTLNLDDSWTAKAKQASLRHLRRLPAVEELFRVSRLIARGKHADSIPSLAPPLSGLLKEVARNGIVRVPIEDLGVPFEATLAGAQKHLETLRRGGGDARDRCSRHIPIADVVSAPEPYMSGLSPKLLDFVERYVCLTVDYLGLEIEREIANGLEEGVRVWHYDYEDSRMIKLIVYLDDVDDGCGPFEAVKAPASDDFRKQTHYKWGDQYRSSVIEKWISSKDVYKAVSPRYSVHIFDSVRVLHRASPPVSRDRYSMTYSYASKAAYCAFRTTRETQAAFVSRWESMLDARQRGAADPDPLRSSGSQADLSKEERSTVGLHRAGSLLGPRLVHRRRDALQDSAV